MIVLYSITGLVSVMFLVVILSGAIRAIRNPERYGPRAGNSRRSRRNRDGGMNDGDSSDDEDDRRDGGQSRTRGLTRAILDTFPVVKFGRGTEERVKKEDSERSKEFELERIEFGAVIRSVGREERKREADDAPPIITDIVLPSPPSPSSPTSSAQPIAPPIISDESTRETNPGETTTTCPICVETFEPDDDIRVLPCDGRHAFHRDCIDPWLLEVPIFSPSFILVVLTLPWSRYRPSVHYVDWIYRPRSNLTKYPTPSSPPPRPLRRLIGIAVEGGEYHAERAARKNEEMERTNNSSLPIYEACSSAGGVRPTLDHRLLLAVWGRGMEELDWEKVD